MPPKERAATPATKGPGTAESARAAKQATVAIGFVTGMLSGMAARGADAAPLLREQGLDPTILSDPQARVPIGSYAALYNAVVRHLDDEGFGLFDSPLRLGSFEFLCRSVVSSRRLEEALDRAGRFLRIVLPQLRVAVSRERGTARLEIAEAAPLAARPDDPRRVFAFEWLLRLLHGLSCWLVGRGLSLDSVAFPYPRPPHAADYGLIYTERSSFQDKSSATPAKDATVGEASANGLEESSTPRPGSAEGDPTDGASLVARFNANLLDLPIRRDEEALSAFLEGAPGKISMLYRRDREMVRQVRDLVAAALPQAITLEEVAARLHLSHRTLHRRLHEEGSSFRAIKDAVRRDFALSRLEKTNEAVAKIAADLGYSEPSAFFRAFQSWTGMAPTHYRKRLS